MSQIEIANLVQALGDIVATLHYADPADKAEVYRQLGLRLTYHQGEGIYPTSRSTSYELTTSPAAPTPHL